MKPLVISLTCIVTLYAFTNCGTGTLEKGRENLDPQSARKKLEELKIEFKEATFLDYCSTTKERPDTVGIVKLFIGAGMSPNARQSPSGKTALILASEQRNAQIVKVLVDAGADVEATTDKVVFPFDYSMLVHKDAREEKKNAKHTALLFAAYWGNVEAIKILLQAGADPNKAKDQWGHTALNIVCNRRGIINGETKEGKTVRILRDMGMGPPNVERGVTGQVVGEMETIGKKEETVKALLDGHADPNITNCNGTTPLMGASAIGSKELVEMLLKAGADCSKKNLFGNAALDIAQNPPMELFSGVSNFPAVVDTLKSYCH